MSDFSAIPEGGGGGLGGPLVGQSPTLLYRTIKLTKKLAFEDGGRGLGRAAYFCMRMRMRMRTFVTQLL